MPRTRRTPTLLLPRGAHIEIEYNPRRPSIRTIVRQVEALGYWVVVRPWQHQPYWQDINNHGFTSQRVCAHLLLIYPPPIDPQWNEEEIAREQLQQVHIKSVEMEITEDLYENGVVPDSEIDYEGSPFSRLTLIEYQGVIINWLQREYGEHMVVEYTLYEEYLAARNEGHLLTTHKARLSDLLLQNRVMKGILHDAWYLPENPEFAYECIIRIQGSRVGVLIVRSHYEFRGRRIL